MTDRYGKTRVSKIRAAFNELRAAIRAGDMEAAEAAWDRVEPWLDYVFQPTTPAEAARVLLEAMVSDTSTFHAMTEAAERAFDAGSSMNKAIGNALRAIEEGESDG